MPKNKQRTKGSRRYATTTKTTKELKDDVNEKLHRDASTSGGDVGVVKRGVDKLLRDVSNAVSSKPPPKERLSDTGVGAVSTKHERVVRELDLERALFRWYERYQSGQQQNNSDSEVQVSVVVETDDLIKKARSLAQRLGAASSLVEVVDDVWIRQWQARYGVPKVESDTPEPPHSVDVTITLTSGRVNHSLVDMSVPPPSGKSQRRFLHDVDYTDEQIYFAYGFEMDWKSLPDRTLEKSPHEEKVWVLMAGNKAGHHRTRVLITGHEWRPKCLKHVNMLSQPVVYAGGGSGVLTPELFKWWFFQEFVPATTALNSKVVLVIEQASFLPQETDCSTPDGTVRLAVVPRDAPEDLDHRIVPSEFRTRYAITLLSHVTQDSTESISVPDYLKRFTLKDAFPMLHRSWLNVRSETFQRCWEPVEGSLLPHKTLALSLTHSTPGQVQGDRVLLLELQWLSHDLGLEVTDDDLAVWARDEEEDGGALEGAQVKLEAEEDGENGVPTAGEAVRHLEEVLLWMESEPLDPGLLLAVRDILTIAKQASKMGLGPTHPGAALPFFCHNGDHLSQPPPAHMGIPPYQLDPKGAGPMEYWRGLGLGLRNPPAPPPPPPVSNTSGVGLSPGDWKRLGPLLAASGLARPPMYPFSTGQYPYPMLSPEMSQVASWHTPSMYPISTGGGGFRSPYPSSLPITSTSCLTSDLYRFSPLPPPPGLSPHSHSPHHHSLASHPAIVTPGPKQPDLQPNTHHHTQHRQSSMDQKNSTSADNSKNQDTNAANNNQDKKKPHIKKPLNAFMLYMKEMRAKVVAECTLKESAAINQILGRRWHALGREEQAKYYELARRERQLHMQLYPDWSSRANSTRGKKRKRKQDTNDGGNSMKKCRARYGLDQQSQWCKPCRRKKKCIRYMEAGDSVDGNQSEDNLGSSGSVGEALTPPDDDTESLHRSISSPGCLSGLSSLTSPSMILPSPSTSLASPSVSLASPCMSLQSPLTPHHHDVLYECKVPAPPLPLPPPHRNPVGTNPHDINNPLSVNQLTGQCVKQDKDSRSVIGVT